MNAFSAEYSLYPKPGVYDGSDAHFDRELIITADGKFTLEVTEKSKNGSARSGSGSGKLSDAPGGWDFSQGRCSMTLKRAMGGMQMRVEGCSSNWGDVSFDGKYKLAGDITSKPANTNSNVATAKPASTVSTPATPAPAVTAASTATTATPSLPSRKELLLSWSNIMIDGIAGKHIAVFAKSGGSVSPDIPLERFTQAAFFIDSVEIARELPPAQQAKTPLQMFPLPLPPMAKDEGISFRGDCIYGKYDKTLVIFLDSYHKTKGSKSKPVSAWMIDSKLQLQEIKPVSKVKCPASSEY
ncbi:hypothetical protein [Undibacterium squillarum]|uniref:Uncharacterized protein n=1 Tax=Undibacterium squillarum TaxID=1131567 RepID=A0ABQ2Y3N0_9BURK|nr:hypothetical protein [Undibacterium squillarum]GGX51522.1 hypothetical protein GCM10010946_32870 [Undibacterium squillarum]